MKADLHIHSVYSDGKLTVKQLADYAKERGIDIIAITDHDSVGAYLDVQQKLPIRVILGVEISATYQGEEIHVLGYFKEHLKSSNEVLTVLKKLQLDRKERVKKVIKLLKQHFDIELTYEDISKYADGTIGRAHIAKAIIKKYGYEWEEIFTKYIGNDAKAYVPAGTYDMKEAIALLKRNNALVVLAHPVFVKKTNLEDLLSLGFDGIEVRHPSLTEDDEQRYYEYAKRFNLFTTAGSDFHEPDSITAELGCNVVEGEELTKFLEKLN